MKKCDIEISIFKREDVKKLRTWTRNNDYLLHDYDVIIDDEEEEEAFYSLKKRSLFKRYYKAVYKGELIAYIGMKKINYFLRKSELSIVMNPARQNAGFGYKIMKIYLDKYFNEMRYRKISLEVNAFNKRAIRLYEKLGFKRKAYYLDLYNNQDINRLSADFLANREHFIIDDGDNILSYIYAMELTKDDFNGI